MIVVPQVIGLTLCERFEVSSQPARVSLVGVFQALRILRGKEDADTGGERHDNVSGFAVEAGRCCRGRKGSPGSCGRPRSLLR